MTIELKECLSPCKHSIDLGEQLVSHLFPIRCEMACVIVFIKYFIASFPFSMLNNKKDYTYAMLCRLSSDLEWKGCSLTE